MILTQVNLKFRLSDYIQFRKILRQNSCEFIEFMLTTELSGVVTCCKFLCCCAITGSIPLSTGGLLVSNGISVSVYLLDIFIVEIYSFYPNNVIFIKK